MEKKSRFSWTRLVKDCQNFAGGRINKPQSSKFSSNGGDWDIEPIKNDFKDPEDGFWDKNNSKGSNSQSQLCLHLETCLILQHGDIETAAVDFGYV